MKKVLVLSAAAILFITKANSMTTNESLKNKRESRKELKTNKIYRASSMAKREFEDDFPNTAVIQWQRMNKFEEANFIKDGQPMSAFYDENAELVGTTTKKVFSDLPARAQKTFAEKFSDYNVAGVILFDDNEENETDMFLYDQLFEDKDSYFVELIKDNKKIVEQVDMDGNVSYFRSL